MEASHPNVLAGRYASERMRALWSPERRVVLERRLWLAVLEAQRKLGLDVDQAVVDAYEAVVEVVDLESIATREAVTRHDVKARIDEFCTLAGHESIHLGMTSRDVTENTEQLLIRDSLKAIRDDLVAVIARLADLAEAHASTVMVARTHNVAAQATTLGKRFADAAAETMLGYSRVAELLDRYPLRGIKGPVGTRLDQLDLLGSAGAVDELERLVADHLGFGRVLDASGQTYPRSLDLDVVAALVQAVSGPASLATTVRLMAGLGLASEGFDDGQVASSAMPHKANARSSERIGALTAVLGGHLAMAASLAGRQWNEGDVSCSAVRRVMLPDSFCAADGLLHTALAVLEELRIDSDAMAAEFQRFVPVLATTRLLSALVQAGMGRETAHALLAEPTRNAVQQAGRDDPVDLDGLLDRLAADDLVPLVRAELTRLLAEPERFTGTASEQTARVVEAARRIIDLHPEAAAQPAELRL
ncbi:MAG: adenylosuccinate lyase [Acidimicrobiaceae bacterium]|nr:adenylosuccinate lyase [Acidimicrobiaceae bacterium]MYE08431.1 adenylosuccinate lyase [Acidimicrobiaceae bacterium]MYI34805.1 adenylosuccinate lyase [Acidimicrobiaceae bacterium]